jgi:3-phenylpropionate/trans-cinnamate dioxygenase ferredoxin reductase subunit
MTRPIVVVGGGLAALRCAETLRRCGHDGPIVLVSAEAEPPYDRPPLSKDLLAGEISEEAILLRPPAWYAEHDVELRLGERATSLDAGARELLTDRGRIAYSQLVIATGADARALPGARALTLRDVADTRRLRARLAPGSRLVIVGGGLIGLEVAATARKLGADVRVLERGPAPMSAALGESIARLLAQLHRAAGVRIATGARVASIGEHVVLEDGRTIEADTVLVAIGGSPATGWLAGTPLHDTRGIPVDEHQRTRIPHVLAAGDCARPWDPVSGANAHVDHWEAAARQGTVAARTILGLPVSAAPPRSFWSDQHGVRLHVVGETAGADRFVIEGDVAAGDASVHYFRGGRLTGALLLDRGRELPAVRRLLTDTTPERSAA